MLAFGTPGPMELLFIICYFVLPVLLFWKICTKAGFPGPLALLMIVPLANVALLFYLAFAPWPALNNPSLPNQ